MIAWLCVAHAAPLPVVPPPRAWSPPEVEVRTLSNGVPVLILPRRPTGTFEVRLVLRVGEAQDPAGMEGLAATAFDLADEAVEGLDAAAFSAAVRTLGAELESSSTGDTSAITVRGVRRNLARALDLWTWTLLVPTFSDGDLRVVRQRRIDRIALQLREPAGVADRVQDRLQYGAGWIGRSPDETSLAAIDGAAVRAWWKTWVGAGNAAVVAGGDLDADELVTLLEARISGWTAGTPVVPDATPLPVEGETLVLVDLPGASQSALRGWFPVGPIHDPARAALDVANEALGGAFTSRVNLNLREEKGFTYGARCTTVYREGLGFVQCATLVRADATAAALVELRRELGLVVTERPLAADEVVRFRDALSRALAAEHQTTSQVLSDVARAWVRGLPADSMTRYLREVSEVGPESSDAVLRAHLAPDRVTWLVVGDLAALRPSLEALGLPSVDQAP